LAINDKNPKFVTKAEEKVPQVKWSIWKKKSRYRRL